MHHLQSPPTILPPSWCSALSCYSSFTPTAPGRRDLQCITYNCPSPFKEQCFQRPARHRYLSKHINTLKEL